MEARKVNTGSCSLCGKPAKYVQIYPGGRSILHCEQHVPPDVKKMADKGKK